MPNNQPVSKPTSDPSKAAAKKPSKPRRFPGQQLSREELSRHERELRATRLLFAGMGALFVVVASILGFGWWREYAARPYDSVATVAGHNITLDGYARMLDFRRKSLEQQMQYMQAQLQASGSDSSNTSLADLFRQQIQQLQFSLILLPDQTLSDMIDQQLVQQEAARRGITASAQDVDNEINKEFGGQPAPSPEAAPTTAPSGVQQATPEPTANSTPAAAAPTQAPAAAAAPTSAPAQAAATPAPTADVKSRVNGYLAATGLSEAELRSLIESQLLYQKLQDAMGAEVPTSAEQLHARHILVDSEDKAKEIEDKLKNGANFEELAKAESADTATKDKGGDLGWFPRGKMVTEFDDVAFKLEPNQISDPVKTDYGFHIIQLLEKDPNRPLDPQDLEQRKSEAISQWLQKAGAGPDVKRSLTDTDKGWVYKRINWAPPA